MRCFRFHQNKNSNLKILTLFYSHKLYNNGAYNTTHILDMHKKSELEAMSQEELTGIAKELGIPAPEEDKMGLIYQIIDEESILSAAQKAPTTKTTRKRTRIAKKEPDHVYSASQGNGENLKIKKKAACY